MALAFRIEAYDLAKSFPGKGCCELLFECEQDAVSWAVAKLVENGKITRSNDGWVYDDHLFLSEAEVLHAWQQDLTASEFLAVLPLALVGADQLHCCDLLPIVP